MEGGDFYRQDLLAKNLVIGYIKKLEAAVPPDSLINIRINYLMSCIANTGSENLTTDTAHSNRNPADDRLFRQGRNSKINEPVEIKAENQEILSQKGAENDMDALDLPEEVKFEIFSDSESDESSDESLTGGEPKSKRLCKINPTSYNEISSEINVEIKEPTDLNPIENEVSSGEIIINNEVIMENIFKHLPLTDLLSFRTVSTDWDKKIISHLNKNNILALLTLETWNIQRFISLMKSSKKIPFTKFDLLYGQVGDPIEDVEELLIICGSSIKHMKIVDSNFTEKLHQFVPNLESLHLQCDVFSSLKRANESEADDDIIAPFVFSKLRDIKYILHSNSVVAITTFFKSTPNLDRLEVRNGLVGFEKEIVADLVSAGRLANITKLHLSSFEESTFTTLFQAAKTGPFLEEFCVNKIDKEIDLDNLSDFLSTQGKSLKQLKIPTTFLPRKLLKSLKHDTLKLQNLKLRNMVALTSLSFSIEKIGICPQTENALEDLPNLVEVSISEISPWLAESLSSQFSCSTVTKLKVGKMFSDELECDQNVFTSLGILFPCVKSLKLSCVSWQCVEIVTTVWPKLKYLKFDINRFDFKKSKYITCFAGIQMFLPCILKLKDLETLSIFETRSMEQRLFRFGKSFRSRIGARVTRIGRTIMGVV